MALPGAVSSRLAGAEHHEGGGREVWLRDDVVHLAISATPNPPPPPPQNPPKPPQTPRPPSCEEKAVEGPWALFPIQYSLLWVGNHSMLRNS